MLTHGIHLAVQDFGPIDAVKRCRSLLTSPQIRIPCFCLPRFTACLPVGFTASLPSLVKLTYSWIIADRPHSFEREVTSLHQTVSIAPEIDCKSVHRIGKGVQPCMTVPRTAYATIVVVGSSILEQRHAGVDGVQ